MTTLVCFHAHPDDECIQTGGTMAMAAEQGHRVVLVLATRGEHGEVADGFLDPGEELWQRRIIETDASAKALGVQRVEFLGYVDSGMIDTPENDAEGAFWQADVEDAARKLAAILEEEDAEVLTIYDDHGGYGHPDHIQVHRVGVRAAELAGTPVVYEATMNRDFLLELIRARVESGDVDLGDVEAPEIDKENFGQPAAIMRWIAVRLMVLWRTRSTPASSAARMPTRCTWMWSGWP